MQNVLITGGNKGIGLATTKLFLEKGYFVYCLGRNFDNFQIAHDNLETIAFDISRLEDISSLISKLKPIDILVNNAGFMTAQPHIDYPDKDREKMIKVNLEAPTEFIKSVINGMLERKFGRIINISSTAGVFGHPDIWYGICKAGLINLTKSLSNMYKESGVTINCIIPGPVATDMIKTIPESRMPLLRKFVQITGKVKEPEDIAKTILFISQNDASYINGVLVELNNGVNWI